MGSKVDWTPEGVHAREAVFALYRELRLPEPKVVVARDAARFAKGVRGLQFGLGQWPLYFAIAVTCAGLFILLYLSARDVLNGTVFILFAVFPLFIGLVLIMALSVLGVGTVRFVDNPFIWATEASEVLNDALESSGVVPRSDAHDGQGLLRWDGSPSSSLLPFSGTADNEVARLALELRRATDGAVLGKGQVFLLPVGFGRWTTPSEAPVAKVSPARLRRRITRLEPAAAQAVFEENGVPTCMAALGTVPFVSDETGSLWDVDVRRGRLRWLKVSDPATGADAWLSVPNHVRNPREAVAWSYGMRPDGYAPTLEG